MDDTEAKLECVAVARDTADVDGVIKDAKKLYDFVSAGGTVCGSDSWSKGWSLGYDSGFEGALNTIEALCIEDDEDGSEDDWEEGYSAGLNSAREELARGLAQLRGDDVEEEFDA